MCECFRIALKSIEVSIVIISLPTLLTKTSRMPLVTIYGDDDHYHINKTLGRALDPRANGTWLSKLTE